MTHHRVCHQRQKAGHSRGNPPAGSTHCDRRRERRVLCVGKAAQPHEAEGQQNKGHLGTPQGVVTTALYKWLVDPHPCGDRGPAHVAQGEADGADGAHTVAALQQGGIQRPLHADGAAVRQLQPLSDTGRQERV